MKNWIKDKLPDDDMLVVLRVDNDAYPVVLGFRDAGDWLYQDASLAEDPILGWMEMETAATILDSYELQNTETASTVRKARPRQSNPRRLRKSEL